MNTEFSLIISKEVHRIMFVIAFIYLGYAFLVAAITLCDTGLCPSVSFQLSLFPCELALSVLGWRFIGVKGNGGGNTTVPPALLE